MMKNVNVKSFPLRLVAAAMIRGNRANCAQFAQSYRLDWLVHRLESQMSSKGKQCLLFAKQMQK